jgi:hypothetical protein
MSSRDPKSATARRLEAKRVQFQVQVDPLNPSCKDGPFPDELRRWIDLVIVPILVEQYLREIGAPGERGDG